MSVAEVARLTHIRPDRIVDLENDDYSNFPSLAYARGFLLLYARLLKVDVSGAMAKLQNSNPLDIGEYEYLSGSPVPLSRSTGGGRKAVAIVVAVVSVFLAGTAFVLRVINSASRLGPLDQLALKQQSAGEASPPPMSVLQTQTQPAPPAPPAPPEPEARKAAPADVPAAPEPTAPDPAVAPAASPAVAATNEIVLHPVKKAWVKIQRDGGESPPLFEDWLYPDANGLTLRGEKFRIQLSDGAAVEIRKNGQVVPYSSPGIIVE